MPMTPGDYVRVCPHCGTRTRLEQQHEFDILDDKGLTKIWLTVADPGCGGTSLFEISADGQRDFIRMIPERIGDWSVAHLPEPVEEDWQEAIKVFDVGAHRMAVVACGRTLEAAADARGVEKRTLDSRIRKMMSDNLITSEFGDAMTYVRFIRNTGAHAGQDVPADAAEGTMRFTLQALRLLFEVPGELGRLKGPPAELADDSADEPPAA
jgi:hypothetical protein